MKGEEGSAESVVTSDKRRDDQVGKSKEGATERHSSEQEIVINGSSLKISIQTKQK